MDWQIGCCTMPWSSFSLDRALDGVKAAGFSYVGLGFEHQGEAAPSLASGVNGAREVGIKLEALELNSCMMVASWEGDTGTDDFKTRIDQADVLGVRYLVTTGAAIGEDGKGASEQTENPEAQFLARMSKVVPYAREKGIAILLKTHE